MFITGPPPHQHTKPLCRHTEPLCGSTHLKKLLENNCQSPMFIRGPPPINTHNHCVGTWNHCGGQYTSKNYRKTTVRTPCLSGKIVSNGKPLCKPHVHKGSRDCLEEIEYLRKSHISIISYLNVYFSLQLQTMFFSA